MGFGDLFSSTSSSQTSDSRQQASSSGQAVQQGGAASSASAGALQLTGYSDYAGQGGTTSRTSISGSKDVTLVNQSSDPDVLKSLISAAQNIFTNATKTVTDTLQSSNNAAASAAESNAGTLGTVTSMLGSLAESKQTGGQSNTQQFLLYLFLGGGALAAVIFYLWRKK